MNNRVIYRAAKAVREAGLVALRFNFRGVGTSTGSFDEGEGEKDDVVAALDAAMSAAVGVDGPPGPSFIEVPTDLLREPADPGDAEAAMGAPPRRPLAAHQP